MAKSMPVTQKLILDLLAARYRLGETLYTLPATAQKAADALEAGGYITTMRGVVEHSIRASLTKAGRDMSMSAEYRSPLERELDMVRGQLRELRELRTLEQESRPGTTW